MVLSPAGDSVSFEAGRPPLAHSHNFAVATDAWQPVELQQQLARYISVGVMHGDPELRCFGFVRRKGN